jgi:hypothetical protein
MPVISRFLGMIIKMYFRPGEHNPPHIHVNYGEYNALMDIKTLEMIEGDLPPISLKLVKEWMGKYQNELMEIWNTQKFTVLPPLE